MYRILFNFAIIMEISTYNKYPSTHIGGSVIRGWNNIIHTLEKEWIEYSVWGIELYSGTCEEMILREFNKTGREVINTRTLMKDEQEVFELTKRFVTDDNLFGHLSNISIEEYFPLNLPTKLKNENYDGVQRIYVGTGASLFVPEGTPIAYLDMPRWEIQQRMRHCKVRAIGIDNHCEAPSLQYKRGLFVDWPICDHLKDQLISNRRIKYWIDTLKSEDPKMISDEQFQEGMYRTAHGPFRLVPFFDPAPWGGQWMKDVCNLPRDSKNYGWCFDCVPEENSILLEADGILLEFPAQDVVLTQTKNLLGNRVWARFGKDFPIRFDFLDTMGGGNLSLQVHPTNEYAFREFGLRYTQDESYYLLDAGHDAVVFLGLKEDINKSQMIEDLNAAYNGEKEFEAERYVNRFPAHKHDHFLIPSGTIHCSGRNCMVLEISSTPSLFTFKLWDWNRLGLDGKPRPINIGRGLEVIQWDRTTSFVKEQLTNHIEVINQEEGILEEKTGLHELEFIETRRHTFSKLVKHDTNGSVNVLNLVDGSEAVVESPTNLFSPFIIHYAETFIVPACVEQYTIRPLHGECKTIKAFVRDT